MFVLKFTGTDKKISSNGACIRVKIGTVGARLGSGAELKTVKGGNYTKYDLNY